MPHLHGHGFKPASDRFKLLCCLISPYAIPGQRGEISFMAVTRTETTVSGGSDWYLLKTCTNQSGVKPPLVTMRMLNQGDHDVTLHFGEHLKRNGLRLTRKSEWILDTHCQIHAFGFNAFRDIRHHVSVSTISWMLTEVVSFAVSSLSSHLSHRCPVAFYPLLMPFSQLPHVGNPSLTKRYG